MPQNILQKTCSYIINPQNKNLSSDHNQIYEGYSYNIYNYPSFKGRCSNPQAKIINVENAKKINELAKATELFKDENNVFSIDKAVDLIKDKIDTQLMLYGENDIKKVVETVMKENPGTTREEVLNTLGRMSSFSNYDSFSNLEKVLEKENVFINEKLSGFSVNSVFSYISSLEKKLVCWEKNDKSNNKCLIVDRNMISQLKKYKEDGGKFNNYKYLLEDINNHKKIKIILLDGWEAKTDDGYKSFNIIGGWGDLASAASSIIKEQKKGIDPFNDDMVNDLKDLFGENVPYQIVKNPINDLNEKNIAQRFNSRTISKKEIKEFLESAVLYAIPTLIAKNNLYDELNNKALSLSWDCDIDNAFKNSFEIILPKVIELQKANEKDLIKLKEPLTKVFYTSLNVYSPRRMAEELKVLNKKIAEYSKSIGKTPEDALYIVSNTTKSYGLINYQYAKVNNIKDNQIVLATHLSTISPEVKDGKFFVYLDDFAGSGESLIAKPLVYKSFKERNPEQPFLFAPLTCTRKAMENIKKEIGIKSVKKSNLNDDIITSTTIEDTNDYIKVLNINKKSLLRDCFSEGFAKGATNVVFPHIIPDNCSDLVGLLFDKLLRNTAANKAQMKEHKQNVISYLKKLQDN